MLGLAISTLLFIAAVVGVMLLSYSFSDDSGTITLPSGRPAPERPNIAQPDSPDRVEVTNETVQAIIFELSRPQSYSLEMLVEKFWHDGKAQHDIHVSVADGMTSILVRTQGYPDKRILVTPDEYYVWLVGDTVPYVGGPGLIGGPERLADEMQMMITYEDVLALDKQDISDAGFTDFGGEDCIFVEYYSPSFRYVTKYYVSVDFGLLMGVQEYDGSGALIYRMAALEYIIDEYDPSAFTLPDGTAVIDVQEEA